MELLVADMHGFLKGKRIQADDMNKVCRKGFAMCAGIVLLDGLGYTIPGFPFAEADGDPDRECRIVPGSIAPVPWSERPMAQAMFRYYEDDGTPFFADPRAVLERALEPLYKKRLKIVMATELEFYLLDGNSEEARIGTPMVPGTRRPQPGTQIYNPDDLFEVQGFLDDVYAWCDAQKVPAEACISEYSPGQFEINLHHVADAVLACDHAVMLKLIIKAAARKHGLVACFMAKPFESSAGTGMHLHASLADAEGRNVFAAEDPAGTELLRHAIGGLRETMAESMLLLAPHANSYRRFRKMSYAPVSTRWGINNRTVSLRVPAGPATSRHLEHRAPGADANPYLVAAVVLAGMLAGIERGIDPGPPVTGNGYERVAADLPTRWHESLSRETDSRFLEDELGAEFVKVLLAVKRQEFEKFTALVSNRDYEWYLDTV